MRLVCGGAPSCWNQNCHIRFRRIIGPMTVFALTPHQTDFFVMKRHFLNLLRIFSGVNTAILLIYGPILGLTLQTRYVIKRSGISVTSYGVARWVRRIWTTLYMVFQLHMLNHHLQLFLKRVKWYSDVSKQLLPSKIESIVWRDIVDCMRCRNKSSGRSGR